MPANSRWDLIQDLKGSCKNKIGLLWHWGPKTLVGKIKKNYSLLKIRVILILLTLLNLNMTTKLSSHPPVLYLWHCWIWIWQPNCPLTHQSYTSDIAESEYDNQIVLSPTSLKEEKIKLKNTTFVIKSNTLVSNYDVHYQIMNNVVIYIILTTKD